MGKLNARQFIFIILGTTIVSFKTYPNIVIKYGKNDSWIAAIIASIFILLLFTFMLRISLKTNKFNLYEIYTNSCGEIIGNILYVFLILTFFLTLVESSSVESNSMHQNMLLETPAWFLLIFFVVATAYSVNKGLRPLVIITIIGIFFVMLAGTNLSILTASYKKNKYLYPILANGFNKDLFLATVKSLGFYASIGLTLPYLNEIKNKKDLVTTSLVGLIIVIQMEVYSTIGVITTFGYERALTIYYPKLLQTQMVSHFDFLESGELFVMLQIIGGWFLKYCLSFYGLLKLLESFGNKSNLKAIIIISLLVFIVSFFTSKNGFMLLTFLTYYNYISLINLLIIPALVFTIHGIKK